MSDNDVLFCRLKALTKVLIAKGTITEEENEMALIREIEAMRKSKDIVNVETGLFRRLRGQIAKATGNLIQSK